MRRLIIHDFLDVLAAVFQDQVSSTGVVLNKGSDVVDLCADGDIARLCGVVRGDIGLRDRGQRSAGHVGLRLIVLMRMQLRESIVHVTNAIGRFAKGCCG